MRVIVSELLCQVTRIPGDQLDISIKLLFVLDCDKQLCYKAQMTVVSRTLWAHSGSVRCLATRLDTAIRGHSVASR